MPKETEARGAALCILRAVRTGRPFDTALADALPGLPDPDRRLAHEIAAGVLRERRKLDQRITSALTRPDSRMQHDLSDILRIGAYQLSYLQRVPRYAAVETAVELAKSVCGPKSAPLVNAVLRRLSNEAETPAATGDGPSQLASEYSHPDWLVIRWAARYGTDSTRALLEHNNRRPPLTIQPARWSERRLEDELRSADVTFSAAAPGGFHVENRRVSDIPGYDEGGFLVQDSSQRRLLEFAAFPADVLVWDACAAPGGKSVRLTTRGPVIASESSRDRLPRLRENLRRAAPSTMVLRSDARRPPFRSGSFESVLVDAPCSATGTMARHPDARWRLSPARIRSLCRLQIEILDGVAPVVARGGLLVYFTCSLEPEENTLQIDRFLERHSEFQRDTEDLHIFPPESGSDGGYGARMRRAA